MRTRGRRAAHLRWKSGKRAAHRRRRCRVGRPRAGRGAADAARGALLGVRRPARAARLGPRGRRGHPARGVRPVPGGAPDGRCRCAARRPRSRLLGRAADRRGGVRVRGHAGVRRPRARHRPDRRRAGVRGGRAEPVEIGLAGVRACHPVRSTAAHGPTSAIELDDADGRCVAPDGARTPAVPGCCRPHRPAPVPPLVGTGAERRGDVDPFRPATAGQCGSNRTKVAPAAGDSCERRSCGRWPRTCGAMNGLSGLWAGGLPG